MGALASRLHLVECDRAVEAGHESGRIRMGCRQHARIVEREIPADRALRVGQRADERALAGLACPVEEHHRPVRQGLPDDRGQVARDHAFPNSYP